MMMMMMMNTEEIGNTETDEKLQFDKTHEEVTTYIM
jgi:hypothetical protein